jgi:ABC-2 type transport system permease protein
MTAALLDTGVIAGRHLRYLVRQPAYIAITLTTPLVYLLLFSQLFSGIADLPGFEGTYLAFLLPAIVAMAALSTGGWAGTASLEDIDRGVLGRVLVTPVSRAAVIAGHLVQGALIVAIQSVILVAIGWVMGAGYEAPFSGLLVLVAAAVLLASAAGALSHALALTTRNQTTLIAASQGVILPMTFLSTAFMLPELMPGWMATVAGFNPLTWAIDAARLALGGGDPTQVGLRLAWLALFLVVSGVLAIRAFAAYRRAA